MGASTSNNKKGPVSEINVTPLVDVMLVLLVIFMITAPLMLNGINLELPKTRESNPINLNVNQVVLSFAQSGDYYLGKDKVLFSELSAIVKTRFKDNNTDVLFIRADFGLEYGQVAKLMSYLKSEGIHKLALVTEVEKK